MMQPKIAFISRSYYALNNCNSMNYTLRLTFKSLAKEISGAPKSL